MPSSTPTSPSAKPSTSGITTTSTGETFIPASVRPDGSKRKEIRVRPGYRPPEDVEVYKNRTAEAWKNRGSGGVPGAEGLKDDDEKGGSASNKNAKRREARKRAKAAEDEEQKGDDSTAATAGASAGKANGSEKDNWRKEEEKAPVVDEQAEKEKQARNLKKKLRQARELREKKESGESLLPEQFEKVIKINELIRQLDKLGFDANGEPKEKASESGS